MLDKRTRTFQVKSDPSNAGTEQLAEREALDGNRTAGLRYRWLFEPAPKRKLFPRLTQRFSFALSGFELGQPELGRADDQPVHWQNPEFISASLCELYDLFLIGIEPQASVLCDRGTPCPGIGSLRLRSSRSSRFSSGHAVAFQRASEACRAAASSPGWDRSPGST